MSWMILEDRVFRGLFCFTILLESGIIDVARPCHKTEYFWQRHTQRITYGAYALTARIRKSNFLGTFG